MSWNSSTQILTYPFTKLKASGLGDLESALGRTSTSQVDLFANAPVNKWAKYKAVKMTGVSYADQLDAILWVRLGTSAISSVLMAIVVKPVAHALRKARMI